MIDLKYLKEEQIMEIANEVLFPLTQAILWAKLSKRRKEVNLQETIIRTRLTGKLKEYIRIRDNDKIKEEVK